MDAIKDPRRESKTSDADFELLWMIMLEGNF